MIKCCHNCIHLGKDFDSLSTDYLKQQAAENPELYTCNHPEPHRRTWLFGFSNHQELTEQMMCGGSAFQSLILALDS
jgi:hypothetical protein